MSKETFILLKSSDNKGLEAFYTRYGKKLFAYALKNWRLDEDIAWELIYKTHEVIKDKINRYSFESEQKFSSFVMISFLNILRNYYRDNKKNIKTLSVEDINNQAICTEDEELSESENIKSLNIELEKLENWERMLLLLKAQEMPYSEIAKYVDKPENQLKIYYSRLKKKITEIMIKKRR